MQAKATNGKLLFTIKSSKCTEEIYRSKRNWVCELCIFTVMFLDDEL